MIHPMRRCSAPTWHTGFLSMIGRIKSHAAVCFRHLDPEAREEAIQEVVCNALRAYVRLVQLRKVDLAYPSVLAAYGVAQVRDGRKVGGKLNVRDVMSPYCQSRKGVAVDQLDKFNREEEAWQEVLVEDKTAGPAEVVATKLDFAAWFSSLPARIRKIAKLLAAGEKTSIVAHKFGLSKGRISQFRRELAQSWRKFQGESVSTIGNGDEQEVLHPAA